VCSYVHMRLGSVALHNHRTNVCVSMDIMYRSMLQRLPSGNKTIIYLLDEAPLTVFHWRVKGLFIGRLGPNWKMMA